MTRTTTSGIFSVYMVLYSAFAILGGWALDRYGPKIVILLLGLFTGLSLLLTSQTNSPWQLFISYSLLLAIGTGPVFVVLMTTTARWFDKKRGLALGITGAGIGLGTVVMAPFAAYLISTFDWRMAYIVMGLVAASLTMPLSMLVRKDPGEIGLLPDGTKLDAKSIEIRSRGENSQLADFSLLQAVKTRSFWLILTALLFFSLCVHFITTHIVPHATDVGISTTEAALVLGLIGATSIPGRLIMGMVSDRIGRNAAAIICALLETGAMAWLFWAQDLWMFYLFAVVFGFCWGGLGNAITVRIGDIFGLHNLGAIMGAVDVGWGIGAAVGPAVGGLIFDVGKSYFMAFLIGALAMLVTALVMACTRQETNRST